MGWGRGKGGKAEELYTFGPRCYKHRITRQSAKKKGLLSEEITRQCPEDKQSALRRCCAARARTAILRAVCFVFLAPGSSLSRTTKPALLWKCRLSRRHLCIQSAIRIHIARRNDGDLQSAAGCRAAPASSGLDRCIKQTLELSQ